MTLRDAAIPKTLGLEPWELNCPCKVAFASPSLTSNRVRCLLSKLFIACCTPNNTTTQPASVGQFFILFCAVGGETRPGPSCILKGSTPPSATFGLFFHSSALAKFRLGLIRLRHVLFGSLPTLFRLRPGGSAKADDSPPVLVGEQKELYHRPSPPQVLSHTLPLPELAQKANSTGLHFNLSHLFYRPRPITQ